MTEKDIKFVFHELPITENRDVHEYALIMQNLYQIIHDLIAQIIKRNKNVEISLGFVGSILDRIAESIKTISYLSLKNLNRDSAVILVNLIELRTDIKYISKNPKELIKWFKHDKRKYKPWPFAEQLKSIGTDEEIESDKKIYEICSMAKHGNPVGQDVSFNFGNLDGNLFISGNTDYRITDYLFWTYFYGIDAIESGLKILSDNDLEFPSIQEKLDKIKEDSKGVTGRILEKRIMNYIYATNPQIQDIDERIHKLQKEKEQIDKVLNDIKANEVNNSK